MARVKQENDSSQEPAPECSTACSPTDGDFSQQHYLIPGYNLIFIKEEEYVEQEAEGFSVESEPEMWPSNCSTSETANATKVGELNAHSISPVEKCTEPSVTGKKIKLYSCADCSYETRWIYHLKRHMRKHTGEKPFSCELCDYKCAQSSALKSHIRTHTGEKPFSCEYCDYKFAQFGTLKSHIRKHVLSIGPHLDSIQIARVTLGLRLGRGRVGDAAHSVVFAGWWLKRSFADGWAPRGFRCPPDTPRLSSHKTEILFFLRGHAFALPGGRGVARSGGRVVAVVTVHVVHGNRSKLIRNGPGVSLTSNEPLWLIPVYLQIKWCSVRHLRDPYGVQQVT
ncbi:zinc finger protein 628-like [Nilaparvata lugens]|uniref:zinc finger protein 628-like n=1 Tax=Nilaparvata lugens TaxID=108931 RepID=UPI00193CDEF0|nr:zinc finger protein 628-like [Nilaparvata lugens]